MAGPTGTVHPAHPRLSAAVLKAPDYALAVSADFSCSALRAAAAFWPSSAASFSVVKASMMSPTWMSFVAGEVDAALDALADFADVVLEALERGDLALP